MIHEIDDFEICYAIEKSRLKMWNKIERMELKRYKMINTTDIVWRTVFENVLDDVMAICGGG